MTTKWTNNAKEGFLESLTPNPIVENKKDGDKPRDNTKVEFGNEVYIGKDPNELILMTEKKDVDIVASMSTPTPTPTPTTSADFSIYNQINDLTTDFSVGKAKHVYANAVNSGKHNSKNAHIYAAQTMLIRSGVHTETEIESENAKNDLKILSSQISRWFTIVFASYIIALNWWYLWCYTTFTFDFRSLLKLQPLQPNPIVDPSVHTFELFNYYLLNMRMDSDPKLPISDANEYFRLLWHWRPVTFSLFHFALIYFFTTTSLIDGLASFLLMAKDSIMYLVACVITVYYYILLYKSWYKVPLSLGGGVVGLLALIAGTIFTSLAILFVIPILSTLFVVYISFLSHMPLFAFNYFWPPSVYSSIKQIFQELTEAPVYDDNPSDNYTKITNYLFQNFHNIYIVVIVLIPLLIWNITEAASFSNKLLIVVGIFVNLLLFVIFSQTAIYDVLALIMKLFESDPTANNPNELEFDAQQTEQPIPSAPPADEVRKSSSAPPADEVRKSSSAPPTVEELRNSSSAPPTVEELRNSSSAPPTVEELRNSSSAPPAEEVLKPQTQTQPTGPASVWDLFSMHRQQPPR